MTLTLFGAGNIGRSFIAPVFSAAGYETTFVDINETVVSEINARGGYDVVMLAPTGDESRVRVSSVRAIDARDTEAVSSALAATDIAATAVGAGGFGPVCDLIAHGLVQRNSTRPGVPLDVILAENIPGAADLARRRVAAIAGDDLSLLGLVETSIGKMVPIVPAAVVASDPLLVYAEPYNTLIVDRLGFVGPVPCIPDVLAVNNIRAYVDRKLFVHNLGHAAVAYVGSAENPEAVTIAEAISAPTVRAAAERAMLQSAGALYTEYPDEFRAGDLEAHVEDLLARFANPALNDTVFRVGRDLKRKLGPDDRVIGAMRLLAKHAMPMDAVAAVYAAGLDFTVMDEAGLPYAGDHEVLARYRGEGLESVLKSISGLDPENPADRLVWNAVSARVDATG
ncbi:MAG: mannitol-1-phosphate 5-dehydrogenase [Spirochaetaceae bacterium]|nr:mannitol-1-phosphate 5-dehydrogenase [Spirochaetaceae bacterium]